MMQTLQDLWDVRQSPRQEYVDFAEVIQDVMEFGPAPVGGHCDVERELRAELAPKRFAQLKETLFGAWAGDRMI